MMSSGEAEIDPVVIVDAAHGGCRLSQAIRRSKPIELAWPSTPSERERTFERWQGAAMRCLRAGNSDFAVVISFRKLLRSDGLITAANAELAVAAGCTAKTLEFDLARLRRAGLITSTFLSLKGFTGRRRVIRLSLPAPDAAAGRT